MFRIPRVFSLFFSFDSLFSKQFQLFSFVLFWDAILSKKRDSKTINAEITYFVQQQQQQKLKQRYNL